MIVVEPFAYHRTPINRKHGPAGYKNYQDYKPWLRDEFCFRCVYCLERELWYPSRAAAFSVDHVIPQAEDPALVCVYDNLVYACVRCNSWRQDVIALDPTNVAFADHVEIDAQGVVKGLTTEGMDLIDLLDLNSITAVRLRKRYMRTLSRYLQFPNDATVIADYMDAFGFPDELPDLSKPRPPEGNTREAGLRMSYFSLKRNKSLPEVY